MTKKPEIKSLEKVVNSLVSASDALREIQGGIFRPGEWDQLSPVVKVLKEYADKLQESRRDDHKVCGACRTDVMVCASCQQFNHFSADYCYDPDALRCCVGCGLVYPYKEMSEHDSDFCRDCDPWKECEKGHRHAIGTECSTCQYEKDREERLARKAQEDHIGA